MAVTDQPATRERQAGPYGVAERLVVPLKPGNAGGGKGPQLKGQRKKRRRTEGLAMSLTTPRKCSEAADGVACQSEGIAQLSFLCAVRQGVSEGRSGLRLRMLPSQRRSSRSGWPDVRGHRGVRRGAVVGRTGGRTEESNVSTAAGAAGVHTEAGREAAAVGNTRRSGIAWCRWRQCWCSNRSSRPTCSRNSMPIGRDRSALDAVQAVHKLINAGHTRSGRCGS